MVPKIQQTKSETIANELRRIASAAGDLHAVLSTRQTAADVTAGYATMLRRVAHHLMFSRHACAETRR